MFLPRHDDINNKKELVSYDFDNTLKNQYTGEDIKPVVDKMISDYRSGKLVVITTFRSHEYTGEITDFVIDHNVPNIAIIATNNNPKSDFLRNLQVIDYSITHYDDQERALRDIKENIPGATVYKVLYRGANDFSNYDDIVVKY